MDQDREFKARFCWPVQDRDRAKSPSTAPRASSVCSASVYSSRVVPVPDSGSARLLRGLALSSRSTPGLVVRNRAGAPEVGCGYGCCCKVETLGQYRLSQTRSNTLRFPLDIEVDEMMWDRMEGGVASGFSRPLVHPEWRVMGDQDPEQRF